MSGYTHRVTELAKPIASRLDFLTIELTERCDNDCIHCNINLPAGDRQALAREMTTGQVEDILGQAAELGCLEVRFTGGEPLLRTDFERLYLHARRLGFKVYIATNARGITRQLASLWARIPPLEPLRVTVYGMHQESYEAVSRSPGSFAQFRRGIDLLLEHGVPFRVRGTVLPPNRREIDEFEEWAATIPWMDRHPTFILSLELRSRHDDSAKNTLIDSLRLTPEEELAVLGRDEAEYRAEMAAFGAEFISPASTRLFSCGAGREISVDAYGRAQPCLSLRSPDLVVDLKQSSLEEALAHFAELRDLQATDTEYLRRCAVCTLKGLCMQCPAKSWTEHGTLDTPVEYLCKTAHAQARYLGWLDDKENGWEIRSFRCTDR